MSTTNHLTALRLRLGLPNPGEKEGVSCPCGRTDPPNPFHPLLCPLSQAQTQVQAQILQELEAMATTAGYSVARQFPGLLYHLTVPVAIARAGQVTGLQVTISHPGSPSHLQAGLRRKGQVAQNAETTLLNSVRLHRRGDRHIPVSFETYGLMGAQIDGLLKSLAEDIAARSPGGSTTKAQALQFMRHRLSIVAVSAISRAITSQDDATFSNQPPLPPFPSLCDPAWGVDLTELPEEMED